MVHPVPVLPVEITEPVLRIAGYRMGGGIVREGPAVVQRPGPVEGHPVQDDASVVGMTGRSCLSPDKLCPRGVRHRDLCQTLRIVRRVAPGRHRMEGVGRNGGVIERGGETGKGDAGEDLGRMGGLDRLGRVGVALVIPAGACARGGRDRLDHRPRAAVPCPAVGVGEGGRLRPVTARHLRKVPRRGGAPVHLLPGAVGRLPVLVLARPRLSAAERVHGPVGAQDREGLLLLVVDSDRGIGYLHAVTLELDHVPVRIDDELPFQAQDAVAVAVGIGVDPVPRHVPEERQRRIVGYPGGQL